MARGRGQEGFPGGTRVQGQSSLGKSLMRKPRVPGGRNSMSNKVKPCKSSASSQVGCFHLSGTDTQSKQPSTGDRFAEL